MLQAGGRSSVQSFWDKVRILGLNQLFFFLLDTGRALVLALSG